MKNTLVKTVSLLCSFSVLGVSSMPVPGNPGYPRLLTNPARCPELAWQAMAQKTMSTSMRPRHIAAELDVKVAAGVRPPLETPLSGLYDRTYEAASALVLHSGAYAQVRLALEQAIRIPFRLFFGEAADMYTRRGHRLRFCFPL